MSTMRGKSCTKDSSLKRNDSHRDFGCGQPLELSDLDKLFLRGR
uniref:Uncharacterized protein n=1 Tax=Candidatus Kentrum sp. FW TaxID=2126338 RepID=A0A450TUW8_9GAMM|nr:MAG: hypothetical protein BECKFW1821C_GA0114237_10378 [Candidatus Kentron sp. FW]